MLFRSSGFLPVLIQIVIVAAFAVTVLVLSVVCGRAARRAGAKDLPYECGMRPQSEGVPRIAVKFYMVAMLFVLFDIEVVFMYPWAVQFRELAARDATALLSMAGFAGILGVAYLYALKKGALEWKS